MKIILTVRVALKRYIVIGVSGYELILTISCVLYSNHLNFFNNFHSLIEVSRCNIGTMAVMYSFGVTATFTVASIKVILLAFFCTM